MTQEILNKFLSEMLGLLKETKDFAMEQIPQVAKEVLHYNLAVSILWTLVFGATFGMFVFFMTKIVKVVKEDGEYLPLLFFNGVPMLIFALLTLEKVTDVIKIYLAPRLYLIEYLSNLLKVSK